MNVHDNCKQSEGRFRIIYQLRVPDQCTIEQIIEEISLEQTVEVPRAVVPDDIISSGITGKLEYCEPIVSEANCYKTCISYRSDLVQNSVPQFFNVLFGNISLKSGIRILDLQISESMHTLFPGPQFGIEGIRQMTGIEKGPLTSTALKPMGMSSKDLAKRAAQFVEGGISIIKDDHGISNQPFHPFRERVKYCCDAIRNANEKFRRSTLYFPTLPGPYECFDEQLAFLLSLEIHGFLLTPMLFGFDSLRYLREKYRFCIMAHPSMMGVFTSNSTHGTTPSFMLGKMMRFLGADISVFPSWGGRFPFTQEECRELTCACTNKDNWYKPVFPGPAGGMQLSRLPELYDVYGDNAIYLVGGGLLADPDNIPGTSAHFVEQLNSLSIKRNG